MTKKILFLVAIDSEFKGCQQPQSHQGQILLTDLSLILGLNLTQSDCWLSLNLFVKFKEKLLSVSYTPY